MSLPQASNINTDNSNQVLLQLAQTMRVDQLRRQQLEVEDNRRKFDVLNQINPATLSEKFDAEIVDQSLFGLRNNVKEYLRKKPTSFELQMFIQDELSKLAAWNSKVKAVRQGIDDGLKNFNQKGFQKNVVQALAIDNALYKDVDGQKVLKSPDEIDQDIDYISLAAQDRRSISKVDAWDMLNGAIKEMHANPIKEKRTVIRQRGRDKEYVREDVTYPTYMQWDDALGKAVPRGTVVTGDDGKPKGYMVDEDIFSQFSSNPAINMLMEDEATNAILATGGDPSNAGALNLHKRAWLSDYLSNKAGVQHGTENRDIVLPAPRVRVEMPEYLKRDKEYEVLPKTAAGLINFDQELVSLGRPATTSNGPNEVPLTDKGQQMIRVDHLFNGGQFNVIGSDGKKTSVPVYVAPSNRGMLFIGSSDDPTGKDMKGYKGSALDKFLIQNAEINGSDVKTMKRMLGGGSTIASKLK